ncbi:SCO family protein [Terrabacter sp. NPDC080008]|uniref:SCO family protein n=1 Tax=Terrabacter sp. NPDC080008 TaxID=3155176 RepID=UPI00344C9DB0
MLSTRKTVVPTTILVTAAAVLTGCGTAHLSSPTAAPPPSMEQIGTPVDQALPSAILELPLTDASGKTVRLADFAGRTVMLSDNMTLCQETCPMDTATLVQTARDEDATADRDRVVYLSVTVDPVRDTPVQLAAYKKLFTPPPANWKTLTGSPAVVDRLWTFLGVWRQRNPIGPGASPKNWRTGQPLTYDIAHSDEVFFIDAHGHERFLLEGPPAAPKGSIPPAIYRFMSDTGHKNATSPPTSAWTEAQARKVLGSLVG